MRGISMSVTRTSGVSVDGVESVAAVGGAGDDGDVGFEFEQSGEGSEHHGLIFGEDYANGIGGRAHAAASLLERLRLGVGDAGVR